MADKIHVKKGDQVYVLSGKDKAKTGEVLEVYPKTGRVLVEGVNIVAKHKKPRKMGEVSGIFEEEAPIHSSNVMLVDPSTGEPSKVGVRVNDNGDKVRYAKRSGAEIDVIKKANS